MVENYESAQLALFVYEPPTLDALKLWDVAFGGSPTAFQTNAPGHTQAQGVAGDVTNILVVQPNRVDLILQPMQASLPMQGPGPLSLNDLDSALRHGVSTLHKILPKLSVGRCATVLQGSTVTDTLGAAVDAIKKMVPQLPAPADTKDVNFQIVVPRASKINSRRRMLRICRWQTVKVQAIEVVPPSTNVRQLFGAFSYVDIYMEAMEDLDAEGVSLALEELLDEAKRILKGGYNELG